MSYIKLDTDIIDSVIILLNSYQYVLANKFHICDNDMLNSTLEYLKYKQYLYRSIDDKRYI